MSKITLNIDDQVLMKVRKIAIGRGTTLTAMVRDFLTAAVRRDAAEKEASVRKLRQSFDTLSRDMGRRSWTRDQLHGR